ncbi:centromere protein L-like [Babylonia areolata]|uniref:centromere protein L-like n=1 Tax=Babylonia areolata TaxID=304850 RepID=UPI003FD3DD94
METPKTTASTSLALSYTSARRTCPYGRTPRQRRIRDPKPASSSPTTPGRLRVRRTPASHSIGKPGALPGLTGKTWQVFYLSPLYRFSTHPQSLKQYGRSLATYVVQEGDREIAVDNANSKQCAFSVYEGLRVAAGDPEAIQILVTSKPDKGNNSNGGRVLLTAVLCGVDLESNPCVGMKKHFTYYPLLLVKANVALTTILKSWLEMHFDCRLSPLILTSMDLAWTVAMWSGTVSEERKNKSVELLYAAPEECEGLSRITYTIDAMDCKALWDSIRSADSEEFTGEEVGAFVKSLEEHFYECFRVKLWKMELVRVGTAVAYLGEGRLKIFSADAAWQVLRLMSELALEQFQLLATI